VKISLPALIAGLLLVADGATDLQSAPAGPNILFLFADDQAYETIGALGHTDIASPNHDRLLRVGTTSTRA